MLLNKQEMYTEVHLGPKQKSMMKLSAVNLLMINIPIIQKPVS